ncbi:Pycsar system effector family protein [Streptomyces sp. NPDC002676]
MERLLGTVREEIARADTKASILLSGAVALPALVGAAGHGRLVSGPVGTAGAAVWLAGIAMLILVILPRTGMPRHPRLGGARPAAGAAPSVTALDGTVDPDQLTASVLAAGRDPGRWMLEQSRTLGLILAAKYRWMRWAVACLAAGGAAVLVAALR